MNSKNIQKYLPYIAGGVVLLYLIVKGFGRGLLSNVGVKDEESNLVPDASGTTSITSEPYLNDVVKYGSTGEATLRVQQRLNKLIQLCKNAYDDKITLSGVNPTSITRMNKIAKWTKLSTDGKAGTKTIELLKYVMTKSSATLKEVRTKYNNFEYLIKNNQE